MDTKSAHVVQPLEQTSTPTRFPWLELARMQADLDRLRKQLSKSLDTDALQVTDDTALGGLAKEILRSRRQREKIFGTELFGEPAWDILLELYLAEITGQKLCVSSACYASAVPATTALRWITKLENENWVERMSDPRDGRRAWLVLTARGLETMRKYLSNLPLLSV